MTYEEKGPCCNILYREIAVNIFRTICLCHVGVELCNCLLIELSQQVFLLEKSAFGSSSLRGHVEGDLWADVNSIATLFMHDARVDNLL